MQINGLIKKAKWEHIACCCGKDIMDSFPIKECLHCKFNQCWKSVPKVDFKTNNDIIDKTGKVTKKQTRIVKEITLIRGDKYQDIIGWTF